MKIKEIATRLETWAPPVLAESYDNVGLLVGNPEAEVTGVLVNLDVTEALLEEAKEKGANMIITHHPIWFGGRKRLIGEDYVSRIIIAAIKNDIALYAIHTNLDNIREGVNRKICEKMGLENLTILKPKREVPGYLVEAHPQGSVGSGMVGTFASPMKKMEFFARVKEAFDCGGIRYADADLPEVQKVAVCGGSGSFLIEAAKKVGAQAFVTGDVTYHKYFDGDGRILYLDIGHYESEQFTSELIVEYLSEIFPNFALYLSKLKTNPVKYY